MELLASHKNGITIVVVGDRGTGKSTLIQTAASETFPTNVDPVLPPTRLPDDMFPDRVLITVIDSSVEQKNKLEEEMRRADVIVLTYACDRSETRDRLMTYWMPEFRQLEVRVPVLVVGCRLDLKNGGKLLKLDDSMSALMRHFSEIEACIECSACRYKQIPEVFYSAQKAVLYPAPPLFDHEIQNLRPQFVKALKRIFILCDHDKDGSLSDAELNAFQVNCFNAPLQLSQTVAMKKFLEEQLYEGVNESGLSLRGFLLLHTLLVKKWRLEIVWTVLRRFGYNNDVRLDDNLLPPSLKGVPDQSAELTNVAIKYLKGIFNEHDKDGLLRPSGVVCLFSTAPDCPWNEGPYKDAAPVNKFGLTMDGFLSKWVLMTLLDPTKSVEYLKYLAYEGDASSTIHLTRRRLRDRKKRQSKRSVYQGFVFGPKKAGKSALLDAFLERRFSSRYHSNSEERYAVNLVDGSLGSKKFLVLREIPEDKVQKVLSDEESLAACDVAIFVYDSSDESSWEKAADLLMEVAGHGKNTGYKAPSLIVAAKADMKPHPLEIHNSTSVSQDMGIELPLSISVKSGDLKDIYRRIVNCAEHPHLSIPETEAGRRRK